MITRRKVITGMGLGVVAAGLPTVSFARANTDVRLVLFILRGAVDGLAVAPPWSENQYRSLRGELAIDSGEVLNLDGMFGLHPSLSNTFELYNRNEALVVQAVASPYRERSHFDGQDVLENGSTTAGDLRNGWLNRAIGPLGGTFGDESAIALAQNTPLILRGDNSVSSWAPSQLPHANDDTLRRIESLYARDEFFATRFRQALDSQQIAGSMQDMAGGRRNNELEQWNELAESTAKFLTADGGPQVAVLECGGWDTHANQGAGTGYLANRLAALDKAIGTLRSELGDTWYDTAVAVVTEFGRTAKINGTRGTDHGTGGAALLLGGAVNGGQVLADWPGLASKDLYEGRDLYPTMDLRSVFKSLLLEHLQLDAAFVEKAVFPGSASAKPIDGLIRT
jgi:uncharacterized protein (DUF1501 family)